MEFHNLVSLIRIGLTSNHGVMGKVVEIKSIGILIAAIGISIMAFLVLVFLSFQASEVLFSVRNRKLKRIEKNRRKYLMKVMDQFGHQYLYRNGNYFTSNYYSKW